MLILACGDNPSDPGSLLSSCDATGLVHRGVITSETWRAQNSPHFVLDTVVVTGPLTIEAGALVCGGQRGLLLISGPPGSTPVLNVPGTEDRPVRFKPTSRGLIWGGILAGNTAHQTGNVGAVNLRHVQMESAYAVEANTRGEIDIADSHFRQMGAVHFTRSMLNSVVDTGMVVAWGGRFDNTVIRGGSLDMNHSTTHQIRGIHISGGRIEGSSSPALFVSNTAGIPPTVTADAPLRIIGTTGIPIIAHRNVFSAIWPTRESQDSLLGNASDTLVIWDTALRAATPANLIVRRDLPWIVTFNLLSPVDQFHVDTMTVEPGASVTMFADLRVVGRISAVGTPAAPIRFIGPARLILVGTAQSEFENVIFENVTVIRQ